MFIFVGVDDLIANCRVGTTTKEKLTRVIEWLQRSGSTLCNLNVHSDQVFYLPFYVYLYFQI